MHNTRRAHGKRNFHFPRELRSLFAFVNQGHVISAELSHPTAESIFERSKEKVNGEKRAREIPSKMEQCAKSAGIDASHMQSDWSIAHCLFQLRC